MLPSTPTGPEIKHLRSDLRQKRTPAKQLCSSVIMVKPVDFGFNEQTGSDNEFQHRPSITEQSEIGKKALQEFETSVEALRAKKIEVLILEKEHTNKLLPDAVFPNNWFSTAYNNELTIYPMKAVNRQQEVQIPQLKEILTKSGYQVEHVNDLRQKLSQGSVLEGTGSLIFHHPSNQIFSALSERCQSAAVDEYAEQFGYHIIQFNTQSSLGRAIYHSNVLMSCGEKFVVITESVVLENERKRVMNALSSTVDDIVIISEQQMALNFCGNILQLQDTEQQPIIVMSNSAYQGFTNTQRRVLERHGSLLILDIPVIERIGGGSARCMLAENFLQKITA
jgi:hypothetical protein